MSQNGKIYFNATGREQLCYSRIRAWSIATALTRHMPPPAGPQSCSACGREWMVAGWWSGDPRPLPASGGGRWGNSACAAGETWSRTPSQFYADPLGGASRGGEAGEPRKQRPPSGKTEKTYSGGMPPVPHPDPVEPTPQPAASLDALIAAVKDLATPDFDRFKAWFRGYYGASLGARYQSRNPGGRPPRRAP
jgi:hypothetical protein